jgi:hypothetical protein
MPARFDPTVELAPGADLTAEPSTWSWTDITDYVFEPTKAAIRRGRPDRYAQAPPAAVRLTLLNPDGIWCPDNPLGTYYGQLDINTPLRVLNRPLTNTLIDGFARTAASSWGSADTGGAWTNTGGAASDYSVSSANGGRHLHTAAASSHYSTLASLSIVRSDVRVRVRVNALSTGAAQTAGITVRWASASANRRAEVQFGTAAALTGRLIVRDGGVDTVVGTATATPTHTAATWYWIRLQTGLTTARMKVWEDGTDEPATWLLDGEDGFFSNPAAGYCGVYSMRETGNTNANATVDFDGFEMVDGPRIQFTGYVDSWPTTWVDQSEGVQLAPITASGRLKQISQAQQLKSALRRASTAEAYSGAPLAVAYWPMEDASDATILGSAIAGAPPMSFTDLRPAGTAMAGSDPLPTFGENATFYGVVPAYASSSEWAVRALMKFDAGPSVNSGVLAWTTTGTLSRVAFVINTGGQWSVHGYNTAGVEVFGTPVANFVDVNGGPLAGQQFYMVADATQNGGNIDWSVMLYTSAGGVGLSGSYAGTVGAVARVFHSAFPGYTAGGYTIGHVAVGSDTALLTGAEMLACGYAGELTSTRFTRLAAEENLPNYFGEILTGAGSTTQTMGPQRTTSLIGQLREVEATEFGLLFDGKQGQVTLLPRTLRQNHAVDLVLDHDGRDITGYQPIYDDVLLRNDIRVTNAGGASATAQDLPGIRARGVRPETATINAHKDTDVQLHADWRLNIGKTARRRWPGIVIDLARSQDLIEDWLNCDIGSRMTLTNLPAPPFYDDPDLLIEGYTEVFDSFSWTATIDTSPAEPWNVFELDDPVLGWMHTSGSELASGINSSATSLSVATPTGPVWPTTASPFDIVIGGERMTVNTVTGTSTPQTFDVTRSVNGVVKAHLAAAAVVHYGAGVLGL